MLKRLVHSTKLAKVSQMTKIKKKGRRNFGSARKGEGGIRKKYSLILQNDQVKVDE